MIYPNRGIRLRPVTLRVLRLFLVVLSSLPLFVITIHGSDGGAVYSWIHIHRNTNSIAVVAERGSVGG